MDSRERTFLTLDLEEPDRIPIDFWMSTGFRSKLESGLPTTTEEFLDSHDVDLRYIEGPRYVGPALRRSPGGAQEDLWGVPRRPVEVRTRDGMEVYQEVVRSPLSSVRSAEELEDCDRWPSPDWFDYTEVEAQCLRIRNRGRVAVFMGDRLNRIAQLKPAMYLRGVQEILEDLILRPELASAIIGRIRAFYLEYAARVFQAARGKLDIVLTGDDYGSQMGPLISPTMWTRFLGQGFREYTHLAKSYGIRVMHHTCGAVRPLIPLMIERGLDVLQSLQPEASGMDAATLKAEFGGRLAFHGGISIQRTLPFGTPEDVSTEVRNRIEALGKGGGYILCTAHNVQADTPLANVLQLLKAYHAYGHYEGRKC